MDTEVEGVGMHRRLTLHIVWAMVGLTAFVALLCTVLLVLHPESGQMAAAVAAIAAPVLMGLMQLLRLQDMHQETRSQIEDNTHKTEEIKTIVNGEKASMAAQIESLKEQVRRLDAAGQKIDSVVINPPKSV